jgi:hypothetical protein
MSKRAGLGDAQVGELPGPPTSISGGSRDEHHRGGVRQNGQTHVACFTGIAYRSGLSLSKPLPTPNGQRLKV